MRPVSRPGAAPLVWAAGYVVAWTLFGLFFFSRTLVMRTFWFGPLDWRRHLASWMMDALAWATCAPVVIWLSERLPIGRSTRVNAAAHVGLSVSVAAVVAAVVAFVAPQPTPGASVASATSLWREVIATLHQNLMVYWLVLVIQHAYQYHRRYREREHDSQQLEIRASALRARLAEADLANLRAHVQPRFVTDTLDAIGDAARKREGARAEDLVGRLGDFLRDVLEDLDTPEVPLSRELEHLELFLAIERIRTGRPLLVRLSADADALDSPVPCRLLQQLAAGVASGVAARRIAPSELAIEVGAGDELTIRVAVQGEAVDVGPWSIGRWLDDVRSRLDDQLRGVARIRVARPDAGALIVEAVLPGRSSAPDRPDFPDSDVAAATLPVG